MMWLILNLFVLSLTPGPSPEERGVRIADSTLTPLSSGEGPGVRPALVTWLTAQDHDFGQIKQGKPVNFIFAFKNMANDTIVLQAVRTTCGCTAARYTEEPIAPSGVGEVAIEYDAAQSGAFRKKIRVFFDKQRKPEILTINGEVD